MPHWFCILIEMLPCKTKKELKPFLGIMNYLSKLPLATMELCRPLYKLTPVKTERTWNKNYPRPV